MNSFLNNINKVLDQLGLTAQKRAIHIQFSNSSLNSQVFLQRIDGHHALNEGIKAELICLSTNATISLKAFIGAQVAIDQVTDQGTLFRTTGIITEASQGQSDGSLTLYKLTLEDPTALWHKRRNSRVFMNKSAVDVVETVFTEWQNKSSLFTASLSLDLSGLKQQYDVRPFIMQSNESDYDFLTRLMRSEGINWLIDEAQLIVSSSSSSVEAQKLRLIDDNSQYSALHRRSIKYHRSSATELTDSITSFIGQRSLQPTAVHVQRWQVDVLEQEEGAGSVQSKHQHSNNQDNASLGLEQAWHFSPAWMQDLKGEDQATPSSNSQIEKLNHNLGHYYDAQSKQFIANSTVRDTQVGYWFEFNEHPEIDGHSGADKEFLIVGKHFYNQNNLPKDLNDQIQKLLQQSHWTLSQNHHSEERQANQLILQRRNIPTVPEYNPLEHRPAANPQRAKVVGPSGEEIHVDEWGRIKVRFLFTRSEDHGHDGGAGANNNDTDSAWVDVLTPWAGEGYGARFLPRIGEIVVIDFFDGNIDRPFVVGRLHEAQRSPTKFDLKGQLPDTKKLAGIRSKEVGGEGFGQLRFDDTTGQISTQLQNSHGATQLNLGNLSHPKETETSEGRGEGFELRTDQWGVLRAGQGLLLSTHAQDQATGNHLNANEAKAQLESSLNNSKALSEVAKNQQTDPLENLDNLKAFILNLDADGSEEGQTKANTFKQALMLLASPNSIAVSSNEDIHLSADRQLNIHACDSLNMSTQKSLLAHAQDKISLFAAQEGARLYAGKGKVEIQAQGDGADLIARKGIQIISTEDKIEVKASKKIVLIAGGSQIEISSTGVLPTTSRKFEVKAGQHNFIGGNKVSLEDVKLPVLNIPDTKLIECPIKAKFSSSTNIRDTGSSDANTEVAVEKSEYITSTHSKRTIDFTSSLKSLIPQASHNCTMLMSPISVVDYSPSPLSGQIVYVDNSGNLISEPISLNQPVKDGYLAYTDSSGARLQTRHMDFSKDSYAFDIKFDPKTNLIVATAKLNFKLMKRVLKDKNGNAIINRSGVEVELPYDSSFQFVDTYYDVIDEIDNSGGWFNFNLFKSDIEAILNRTSFYFVPKNCSVGECVCKIPVKLIATEDPNGYEINVFKLSSRADSGNWSLDQVLTYADAFNSDDVNGFVNDGASFIDYDITRWRLSPQWEMRNIHAHETGHLFNWPDEYFAYGGAVHPMYIKTTGNPPYQIDLNIPEPQNFWKRYSETNLMGAGTQKIHPDIQKYYLHQIKEWFDKTTGINWDVQS